MQKLFNFYIFEDIWIVHNFAHLFEDKSIKKAENNSCLSKEIEDLLFPENKEIIAESIQHISFDLTTLINTIQERLNPCNS